MNKDLKLVLSIFISLILPGVGNILYGQKKLGIFLLVSTFMLMPLYILPILSLFLVDIWAPSIFYSIVLSFLAICIDALLVVIAIIYLIKGHRE